MKKFIVFLGKDCVLPLLAGLASGMYPVAFYYSKNFGFVNSWSHLWFFLLVFISLPIAVNYLFYFFYLKKHLEAYKSFVLPVLNGLAFFIMVIVAMDSKIGNKMFVLAVALAFLVGLLCFYFYKKGLFTKILVIQFLLFAVAMYPLSKVIKYYLSLSDSWIVQPDHIENVVFDTKQNIYVIQPDGYINPSELRRGYYNFDNSEFEEKLTALGFKIYEGFRSNYPSTTSSNSSMFSMKHHYFNQVDERNTILNLNPVVKIFKNNGYKTHFFAEIPYLMANRPKISFDYTNIQMKDVSYLGRGFGEKHDLIAEVKPFLANQQGKNFYFFERLLPGHVATYPDKSKTVASERQNYLNNLQVANTWLLELIEAIDRHDPNGLIIIVADHGGYVGWEYSLQSQSKTDDRDLLYSGFSALLAIKWNGEAPEIDRHLKTTVNLFRVLFSHFSGDETLLENLQEDSSINSLKIGTPTGVYKVLDEDGNVIFETP